MVYRVRGRAGLTAPELLEIRFQMAFFTKELLHLNRTMRIVIAVVTVTVVVSLFFLWRSMEQRSLGQNAAYKAPMHVYTKARKVDDPG